MDMVELNIAKLAEIASQASDQPLDQHSEGNAQFKMSDFLMSAFSIFFMQSESWLSYQRRIKNNNGTSNSQTLFKIKNIPTDKQIGTILDKINPEFFATFFNYAFDDILSRNILDQFTVLDNRKLISIDSTEFFNSKTTHCENCSHKYHKKSDSFEYFHTLVGLTICSPNTTEIIPLMPTFPSNSQTKANKTQSHETIKQNREYEAALRLVNNLDKKILQLDPIFLGEAMLATVSFIRLVQRNSNTNFILTCKPGSNKSLFEFIDNNNLEELSITNKIAPNKLEKITYKWLNNIPLTDSQDCVTVNFMSAEVVKLTNNSKIKSHKPPDNSIKTNNHSFITDIEITKDNIQTLIKLGLTNWRKKSSFNSLKTRGYNFEHNFGHGKSNLTNVLATLLIIAFLIHTLGRLGDTVYSKAFSYFQNFSWFINDTASLSKYLDFKSLTCLYDFIIEKSEQNKSKKS
ncbi:MAG: hypothetical protein LBT47_05160 [Deltaproteobacteria bacterium]|jgi:hypothetical protein|nr:hypothetical protein [Deltaproteobacteria bacterium]